jgi:hypothetical protein
VEVAEADVTLDLPLAVELHQATWTAGAIPFFINTVAVASNFILPLAPCS